MDLVVRQIGSDKQHASNDRSLTASLVSVGSEPDQDIRLGGKGVQPAHAVMKESRSGIQIVCLGKATVEVKGKSEKSLRLMPGTRFTIGGNCLSVTEPPAGFDLAIEILVVAPVNAELVKAYRTELPQTGLGQRKLAWSLALITLLVGMLSPLAYYFLNADESESIRLIPVSDSIWSSGPLHVAHAALSQNCSACHTRLFSKVADSDCQSCHSTTEDHVASVELNTHSGIDINGRCASCHKEHNEPISTLVDTSDEACTDCHADYPLTAGDEGDTRTLEKVQKFGVAGHPRFTASVPSVSADSAFDSNSPWPLVRVTLPDGTENSQLKFNHKIHYSSTSVLDENNDVLGCADCHSLDTDGEHFDSISYKLDCSTSGCHELALDARNRLPHGYPDVVVAAIEGYYLRNFGNENSSNDAVVKSREQRRRRFGSSDTIEVCDDTAYACALLRAGEKIDQQFTKTGCITCHTIADDAAEELANRFDVAVVKLTEDYHPEASFDHVSHQVIVDQRAAGSLTGDQACSYCHAAASSTLSSDILMPDIEVCATCHESQQRVSIVPLGCTNCHAYHPQGGGRLSAFTADSRLLR